MNEEFGVLKDMVPACKDHDMHKLAILQVKLKARKRNRPLILIQASIDYLRYLEQCIANLQAANSSKAIPTVQPHAPPRIKTSFSPVEDEKDVDDDDDDEEEDQGQDVDEDQEMENSESTATTPAFTTMDSQASAYKSPLSTHTSPALNAINHRPSSSYASSAVSNLPSPAYGPQKTPLQGLQFGYSHSTSTSPMLLPDPENPDHEATAALLMLNQDRRNPSSGRGLSVKDLLSS